MKRVAVLASGGGRSLLNLIQRRARGELDCEIALVIASAADIGAVQHAEAHGIPVVVAKAAEVTAHLDAHRIDLAVLAGWLKRWPIPAHWQGRAINIHPALLPKFGGKGFYGHHVHEAVLAARETESGCTVHWVTPEYDAGAIIAQRRVAVLAGDTPDLLAARVFAAECELLPEVVARLTREA